VADRPGRAAALRIGLPSLAMTLAGCASLPPRQSSDVNGKRISWVRAGAGAPIVVLQSGLGDGLEPWAAVIQRVAASSTVFAYDRPGYGGSQPAPDAPRSPCDVARELRATLQAAGLRPPYLLVGHSLGGLYKYAFARLFPDDVAGLVLLDPTHPDHWTMLQRRSPPEAALVSGLRATLFSAAMRSEFDGQAACFDSPRRLDSRVSVRILTSARFKVTETPAFRSMVEELRLDWLTLLPGATQHRVDEAGHYIQRDSPDVVAAEIQSVLRQAAGRSLVRTPRWSERRHGHRTAHPGASARAPVGPTCNSAGLGAEHGLREPLTQHNGKLMLTVRDD
jgi:pimeloyl-ACP methyl ester carboxylesterase